MSKKQAFLSVLVFVGHAKLSLPGVPENVVVCLEDSSVVDDEDVFSALPVNTCLMLLCGENTPGNSSVTTCITSHTKQQRLAFCGGNLVLREPTEEVFISLCFKPFVLMFACVM